MGLAHWARSFLDHIGYFTELKHSEKDPKIAENRMQSAQELVSSIDSLTASMGSVKGEDRLNQFLEEIALDQDRLDEKDKQGEGVTLITMHSCKGLEYPHVHIVGLEQGQLLPRAVEGSFR